MGRSSMSIPLRVNSDSERQREHQRSIWPVKEISKAPTSVHYDKFSSVQS